MEACSYPIQAGQAKLIQGLFCTSKRRRLCRLGPFPQRHISYHVREPVTSRIQRIQAGKVQSQYDRVTTDFEQQSDQAPKSFRPRTITTGRILITALSVTVLLLGDFRSVGFAFGAESATSNATQGALHWALSWVLHLDSHLHSLVTQLGSNIYWILFAIVFAETGLIVTPFLPGDSLLFAAGALAAVGPMNIWVLASTLFLAAVLGDSLNYTIGSKYGRRLTDRFLKPEYIAKTEMYYRQFGGKTVILARFVPIVRTFAPFMAGIGAMEYRKFATFNILGAAIWIGGFLTAGFLFGNLPWVQRNFSIAVLAIVAISALPMAGEIFMSRNTDSASKNTPV